jgi:hypothetical protein
VINDKYLPDENQYGLDPMGRARFYGIYAATVVDIKDPLRRSRIKVKVNQTTGTEVTGWAIPCLPITSNANHPDHLPHLASEVAALLLGHGNHSATFTTSTVSGHAHTVEVTFSHTNNHAGKTPDTTHKLTHKHDTIADTTQRWNDTQEQDLTPKGLDIDPVAAGFGTNRPSDPVRVAEHTPHRLIPKVGQQIWVMFVAGDPEYPVWIGVQS